MKHNLIVESPAIKRMRVTDQCRVRSILSSLIEQRFETPDGAFEKK
jgi:hypothetical protein